LNEVFYKSPYAVQGLYQIVTQGGLDQVSLTAFFLSLFFSRRIVFFFSFFFSDRGPEKDPSNRGGRAQKTYICG
jgi:hypothetical protein